MAAQYVVLLVSLCGLRASAWSHDVFPLEGEPIWHPQNSSTQFASFRSPVFQLPATTANATLFITARRTNVDVVTSDQAKLMSSYNLFVNGIRITAGPGHNVPSTWQAVNAVDLSRVVRLSASNVIAVECYYSNSSDAVSKYGPPQMQAMLSVVDSVKGPSVLVPTGPTWTAWASDDYFQPALGGNAVGHYYVQPNELLDRRVYPTGWDTPEYVPDGRWVPAAAQPAFPEPFYVDPSPAPATLLRQPCNITAVKNPKSLYPDWIIDFGQELMGGVNISFLIPSSGATSGYAAGTQVRVMLAEEVLPDGAAVMVPSRAGQDYNSTWTLAGSLPGPVTNPADVSITHHEFIQFRYAQIIGSPVPLDTPGAVYAWVQLHPVGGTGANPWDYDCAPPAVPVLDLYTPGQPPKQQALATFSSSSPALDRIWSFVAYSIVATTLDVNVDGQTRERDEDHIDMYAGSLGQFAIFSPGDYDVQRRTYWTAFGNGSALLGYWWEFKTATALMAYTWALETGDLDLPSTMWSDDDQAVVTPTADPVTGYNWNSLQFVAGLRYFNLSGRGLLSFPERCTMTSQPVPWSCNVLADWPTNCRDGFDADASNTDDAIRNGFGALGLHATAQVARWLNKSDAAARYQAMADSIAQAQRTYQLRYNISSSTGQAVEAYFMDGPNGTSTQSAAVHSTFYAVIGGAVGDNATLASLVSANLRRRGMSGASCYSGRFYLEALYRLGVYDAPAADYALYFLSRDTYPGWGYMLSFGATVTTEAWRPADKGNMDWAHPWCASPSFIIPKWLVGVQATDLGWSTFRIMPQPSNLTTIAATVPTPLGMVAYQLWAGAVAGATGPSSNVTVSFSVPAGSQAQVCLPLAGDAAAQASVQPSRSDTFVVDGTLVQAMPYGRFLCTPGYIPAAGAHTAARFTSA